MTTDETFWDFSLRIYGSGGVPAACLALQDHYGADVNLLLYCCWLGAGGRELCPSGLARALAFAMPWSEHVVRPLRRVRSWMKTDDGGRGAISSAEHAALREAVKSVELEAERLEQQALERLGDSVRPAASSHGTLRLMVGNLRRYLVGAGIDAGPDAVDRLGVIVAAASGASSADVEHALGEIAWGPARD